MRTFQYPFIPEDDPGFNYIYNEYLNYTEEGIQHLLTEGFPGARGFEELSLISKNEEEQPGWRMLCKQFCEHAGLEEAMTDIATEFSERYTSPDFDEEAIDYYRGVARTIAVLFLQTLQSIEMFGDSDHARNAVRAFLSSMNYRYDNHLLLFSVLSKGYDPKHMPGLKPAPNIKLAPGELIESAILLTVNRARDWIQSNSQT